MYWNVLGLQRNTDEAGENPLVPSEFAMRVKKYQSPVGMLGNATVSINAPGVYGEPLARTDVVPAKMRWLDDGLLYAEYQISAYWMTPDCADVTCTENVGLAIVGCKLLTIGAGIEPNTRGFGIPVFGAGVN